ncbi:2-aminoethanethiol dioxygenase [Trichinella murrelli]|uniref:2-aminoethanethiol dioxygenase n=1 Tax=Trichinella murrelli TaxID=144512 RepID=A0A0V0UEM5_9BILA|nr:2-aminoethanethiol dioxygenase [Trichinella murrelli]
MTTTTNSFSSAHAANTTTVNKRFSSETYSAVSLYKWTDRQTDRRHSGISVQFYLITRMMSLIQRIINQAELVARSKCDVASVEFKQLKDLMNQVRAKDLNYNGSKAFEQLGYIESDMKHAPCLYTEVYQNERMNVCIFCVPNGREIPLHDHPYMCGIMKIIEGKALVEAYSHAALPPPNIVDGVPVEVVMHPPMQMTCEDQPGVFTPYERNFHRVTSVVKNVDSSDVGVQKCSLLPSLSCDYYCDDYNLQDKPTTSQI